MNQILKDAKLIKKELNETKSYKTSNTTIINKKIDKLNPIIDNDLKIINKIDETISNTTHKKYINLYSDTLKQNKTILITIQK